MVRRERKGMEREGGEGGVVGGIRMRRGERVGVGMLVGVGIGGVGRSELSPAFFIGAV